MTDRDLSLAALDSIIADMNAPTTDLPTYTFQDADTVNNQRLMGYDAPETHFTSRKSQKLLDMGIDQSTMLNLGLKSTEKAKQLFEGNNYEFEQRGFDFHGRKLVNNDDLANEMIRTLNGVPTDKYDRKKQELYRRAAEKEKALYGQSDKLDTLEKLRDYNTENSADMTLMDRMGEAVDATQSGFAQLLGRTGDLVADVVGAGARAVGIDERTIKEGTDIKLFNNLKDPEKMNKFFGYDDKEARFANDEVYHQFQLGNYGTALMTAITTPETWGESLPIMAELMLGDKKKAATTITGKLKNLAGRNRGLLLYTGEQTNAQIDEFKEANGKEPSAAKIGQMAALNLASGALDRLVFKDLLKIKGDLKGVLANLPKNTKQEIAARVVGAGASMTKAMGEEAGQEYVQTWAEILNLRDTDDKGYLSQFDAEGNKEAITASIMGAGAGGQMKGLALTGKAVGMGASKAKDIADKTFTPETSPELKAEAEAIIEDEAGYKSSTIQTEARTAFGDYFDTSKPEMDAPSTVAKLDELLVEADSVGDTDTVAEVKKLRDNIYKDIEDGKATDFKLGNTEDAKAFIQELYMNTNGGTNVEQTITRLANEHEISKAEIAEIKDYAKVQAEAVDSVIGYGTYASVLRTLSKDTVKNAKKIENVKENLERYHASQTKRLGVLTSFLNDAIARAKDGTFPTSTNAKGYRVMKLDPTLYKTVSGKPFDINLSQALNPDSKSGPWKILAAVKANIKGIEEAMAIGTDTTTETATETNPAQESLQDYAVKEIEARSKGTNAEKHTPKELVKAKEATQFIGEGAANSSTERYKGVYAEKGKANTGTYTDKDTVFVASNGNRKGAVQPVVNGVLNGAYKNIDKAIKAGATIIMDTKEHLNRTSKYNTGEVALAKYLIENGYTRVEGTGKWIPKVGKPNTTQKTVVERNVELDKAEETAPIAERVAKAASAIKTRIQSIVAPFDSLKDKKYWHEESPARTYLYNEDGSINENVATTIGFMALEQFTNVKRLLSQYKTKDDVAQMLGEQSGNGIDSDVYHYMKQLGTFKRTFANDIGKAIAKQLGIKLDDDTDVEAHAKLIADLGQMGTLMLQEQGFIEIIKVPIKEYATNSGQKLEEIVEEFANVQFVRLTNEDIDMKDLKTKLEPLMTEFFGEEVEREASTYFTAPVRDKESETIRKNVGEMEGTETANKVLNKMRKMKFKVNMDSIAWLKTNKNIAMRLLGYVPADEAAQYSLTERESVEAKNKQILESYDELMNVDTEEMYFDWFLSKNGRYFLDSVTINPQTDKLHRFVVIPEGQEVDVDLSNAQHNEMFAYAIAQATGFAVDKNTKKDVIAHAKKMIKLGSAGLERAMTTLTPAEMEEQLHIEIEHLGHYLQAIQALKALEKSKNGKFKTNISAEFDAVTSGFGLKLMQMPIIKNAAEWLARTGIYINGQEKPALDSYQSFASGIDIKSVDMTNVDKFGIWGDLLEILPQTEDGKVTSELRKLFKTPFMTFNYAAKIRSIKDAIGRELTGKILNGLATGDAKYSVIYDKLNAMYEGDLRTAIRENTPNKIIIEGKRLDRQLERMIQESYGEQVDQLLNKNFGEFVTANDTINETFAEVFKIFKAQYDAKLPENATLLQKLEVMRELKDLMPIIAGPLSDQELNDGIAILKETPQVKKSTTATTRLNKGVYTKSLNGTPDKEQVTLKMQGVIRDFEAAVSAGAVVPIHFIDAAIMSKALYRHNNVLGIHDAVIPPLTTAHEVVKEYNQAVFDMNMNYDLVGELVKMVKRVEKKGHNIDEKVRGALMELSNTVTTNRATVFNGSFEIEHMMGTPSTKIAVNNTQKLTLSHIKGMDEVPAYLKPAYKDFVKLFNESKVLRNFIKNNDLSVGNARDVYKVVLALKNKKAKYATKLQKLFNLGTDVESIEKKVGYMLDNDELMALLDDPEFEAKLDKMHKPMEQKFGKDITSVFPRTLRIGFNTSKFNTMRIKSATIKGDYVTVMADKYTYTFHIDSSVSVKTGIGRNVYLDQPISKQLNDFNLGSEADFRDADFDTVYSNVHRSKTAIKELLDRLVSMDKVGTTPAHLDHLKGLLDNLSEEFFEGFDVYLNTNGNKNGGTFEPSRLDITLNSAFDNRGNEMSAAEVYVHELLHAYTAFALRAKNLPSNAEHIKRQLDNLYRQARKHVDVDTFRGEGITEEQAQARYDYIFNNTKGNGLDEFIAYGLTNPKLMAKLETIQVKEHKTEYANVFEAMLGLVKELFDRVFGKLDFLNAGNTIHTELMQLSMQLAQYNNGAIRNVENRRTGLSRIYDISNKEIKKVIEKVSTFVTGGESSVLPQAPQNGTKVQNAIWLAKFLPQLMFNPKHKNRRETVLSALSMSPEGFIQNIIRDIDNPDALERLVEQLGLSSDKVDQHRETVATVGRDYILEAFEERPSTEELKAMTTVVLDTDLSVLAGSYSLSRIKSFLTNQSRRDAEIEKLSNEIKGMDSKYARWLINQSKGLGYYLATHKGNAAQNLNAYNIAKGFVAKYDTKYSAELEATVDKLATLYALNYSNSTDIDAIANLLSREPNGMQNLFDTYEGYKAESKDKLFNNNPTQMIKGYTKEIFDDSVSVEIKPITDTHRMEKEGYVLEKVLPKDKNDTSTKTMGLFVSKQFVVQKYARTATRMTNVVKKGTSLYDVHYQSGEQDAGKSARHDINRTNHLAKKMSARMNSSSYNPEIGSTPLTPVLDETGKVANFRYMMSKEQKHELLKQDLRGPKVLGRSMATIVDKVGSEEQNKRVFEVIKQDMDANYVDGSTLGSNDKIYIKIEANSANKEVQEIYSLLPKNMKDAINSAEEDFIAVRRDMLYNYFGYRNMSITDTRLNRIMPTAMKSILRVAEHIWQDIISIVKVDILIRTPAVLIGNIMSNFMYSVQTGNNPLKVAKLQLESLRNVRDYLKDHHEAEELKVAAMSGNRLNKDVKKLAMLEERMGRNPVHELMEAGMYQAIIEEVSREDFESSNRLSKWLGEKTENTPEFLKVGVNWLYLNENTSYFKAITQAVQMSDFVARATENQLMKERGVPQKERLEKVLDVFINYNKPSTKIEEYMNKMGMVMFTKYMKRVQRALRNGVAEHPLGFLLALIGQELIYDAEDIGEQNVLTRSWNNIDQEFFEHLARVVTPSSVEAINEVL